MRRQGSIIPRTLTDGRKVFDAVVSLVVKEGNGSRRRRLWKRGFRTQREAQAWITATVGAVENDTWRPRTEETFPDYVSRWIENRGSITARTRAGYEDQVRLYLRPTLGNVKLRNVSTDTLRAMFRAIVCSEHAPKPHRCARGRVSPATGERIYSLVHAALVTAVDDGIITRNPATRKLREDLPKSYPIEREPWTAAEVRRFLAATRDDELAALWRLAAATGMRRGELAGISWRTIDLEEGSLRVVQALTTIRGVPVFGPPKSKKGRRPIGLDEGTVRILRRHRAAQNENRVRLGAAWRGGDHELVFTQADGAAWHPDTISDRFRAICRENDLRPIRLHDIRHGAVSLAAADGEDVLTVSRRLGHHSTSYTLDQYGHLFDSSNKAAGRRMGRLLDGS